MLWSHGAPSGFVYGLVSKAEVSQLFVLLVMHEDGVPLYTVFLQSEALLVSFFFHYMP